MPPSFANRRVTTCGDLTVESDQRLAELGRLLAATVGPVGFAKTLLEAKHEATATVIRQAARRVDRFCFLMSSSGFGYFFVAIPRGPGLGTPR